MNQITSVTSTPVATTQALSTSTAKSINSPPALSVKESVGADQGSEKVAPSSASSSATPTPSAGTAATSVTVALSDGTLQTTTKNADGTEKITFADPASPPAGTSGSVLNQARTRQSAH